MFLNIIVWIWNLHCFLNTISKKISIAENANYIFHPEFSVTGKRKTLLTKLYIVI